MQPLISVCSEAIKPLSLTLLTVLTVTLGSATPSNHGHIQCCCLTPSCPVTVLYTPPPVSCCSAFVKAQDIVHHINRDLYLPNGPLLLWYCTDPGTHSGWAGGGGTAGKDEAWLRGCPIYILTAWFFLLPRHRFSAFAGQCYELSSPNMASSSSQAQTQLAGSAPTTSLSTTTKPSPLIHSGQYAQPMWLWKDMPSDWLSEHTQVHDKWLTEGVQQKENLQEAQQQWQ
ncbi:uncharacterized protein C8Q71DRAFT_727601 [Rhodofomes roseus]|uniref:Uncharacterized protein n=1 Tax=Rhodofomes roseus TaxID=34475 RepID=A0ABQ8K103_9APHY|nr:uncharacterized protein C8Q71DRAFT_727601 [Rhodofomes roseus]KAH9830374.1 hypothetical protein C8Q71DRAFT_727601 [Rhodofomes roseus]